MKAKSKTYNLPAGAYVYHLPAELAFKKIVLAQRNGVGWKKVTGIPSSREFAYAGFLLRFNNAEKFNPGEKITLLYED